MRNQAKQAIAECREGEENDKKEETKKMAKTLTNYEKELTGFKSTMDNILKVTKETHNEVQKTKDIMTVIQNDTSQSKLCGSFHSKFVEEYDEDMFKDACAMHSSEVDRPGYISQQSPIITNNDDDCISTVISYYNVEYVITTEEGLEGIDEDDDNDNEQPSLNMKYNVEFI